MTIINYTDLPIITVPYILRDADNQAVGVYVTNQETKESTYCAVGDTSTFFNDYFEVDITAIQATVTANTSFFVNAVDISDLPIYRDIVVFSTRLDTLSDYEQNNKADEYVYA